MIRRHGFEMPTELDDEPELLQSLAGLELVEIIPEGFFAGRRAGLLAALGRAGTPVVVHSIEMSLGTDEPFPQEHFDRIRRVIDAVNCVCYSDHLCMTRAGGREIGQLTTLPFTPKAADVFARKVETLSRQLGAVPFMIENITNRFVAPHSTLSEPAFVRACLARSGASLLLDVTNLHTNAVNFRFDPRAWLDELGDVPVRGLHLAGGEWEDDTLYDTHSREVPDDVWSLYVDVLRRYDPELVIVEWDQDPPPLARLMEEVAAARHVGGVAALEEVP